MTAPQLDDDKLQQYFDGELPHAEAEEVRQALEASESDKARLDQLDRLHELVKTTAEGVCQDLPSDDLYARIHLGIQKDERRGFAKGLRVLEGGAKTRRRVVAAVGTAAALAAAAVLAMARPWADTAPQQRVAKSEAVTEPSGEPATVIEEAPRGSEVVEVDFGGNTGTVFEVEGDAGEPVAVVWIQEEGMR